MKVPMLDSIEESVGANTGRTGFGEKRISITSVHDTFKNYINISESPRRFFW